ncbi:MAG: tRNA (adenosine(37)-N6)-dimethylallyltransferase MiaA [Clostridiales bacterium]|nr:tRNA (adenosine(37)-N6)-dimethylallyltransferase MiaA [Clostridiales bacterium]
MAESEIPVVAVVGATATGKTELAVRICERYGGEVVCADSMQIYKGMDIATAKPTADERKRAVHHLTDFLPPDEKFSVAEYCDRARECILDMTERGKKVVICGGTGLYVSSLLNNIEFGGEGANEEIRDRLKKRAETEGNEALLSELKEIDEKTASKLHPNNIGRVIRALEIYYTTGETMSEHVERSRRNPSPYKDCILFLDASDRQLLYDRINMRVDKMLEKGLLKEAEDFYNGSSRERTSAQAIGCKEFIPYFEGKISYDEAVESVKRETRRYAKRQLTWFNRMENAHKIFIDDRSPDEIAAEAFSVIDEAGVFRK